jgi:hypothetical protein
VRRVSVLEGAVGRVEIKAEGISDVLPCRTHFPSVLIPQAKQIIADLGVTHPEFLIEKGIDPQDWTPLARAAVESMRGTSSATTTEKRRFLEEVLHFCRQREVIDSWRFIGSAGRQDYQVTMLDGREIAIEAKGCGDGNNTTIWDRPTWADEFIVWSLCPESLANDPGRGAWSGTNRLINKVVAEQKQVDAYIVWDGRCGSSWRRCPKKFGITGRLRSAATDVQGELGQEDWLPPPCIFLFPRSIPRVGTNPSPRRHTVQTCTFADMLLEAMNVPRAARPQYVHETTVEVRGATTGTEIQVGVISRARDDDDERVYRGPWRKLKREA